MQHRKLGTTDIEASIVAFGAWAIGGWMWGGAEETDAINAVKASLDAGVNLIDTAPMYGYGRSEEIVGRAIEGRRDEVVLATKCGLTWSETPLEDGYGELHFYGDEKGATSGLQKYAIYKLLRPEAIQREVEESLRRLKTDRIDLYQTHWQEGTTPVDDTMATLLKLKEQGKIRAIGVSNASLEITKAYQAVGAVDVDQERFSMLDRGIEIDGRLDHCGETGVSVLAYSPLANGLLTGRLDPERKYNEGDLRRSKPRFKPDNVRKANAMLERFQPIADEHDATVGHLVIAWTVARYERMHVLCGARNAEQATDNAKAGDITLTSDEIATIDAIIADAGVV